LKTDFSTKEKFVDEVEKTFSSLKGDDAPFALGVNLSSLLPLEVDVNWRIRPHGDRHWSLSEVEFVLDVVASRQTPNVKETKLSLYGNQLGDIPDGVWKLMSKLHNLTHLDIGLNELSVVSPLVGDLIHLQQLDLCRNKMSAEGVVVVCELLKVC